MVEGAESQQAAIYSGALTYYPSIAKQAVIALGCAAFTAIFVMIVVTNVGNNLLDMILGALGLVFFGAGGAIVLLRLLAGLAVRHPWLQLDGSGISSDAYRGGRHIPWADVAEIAIYRQRPGRGAAMYYLLVNVREPERLPQTATRSFNVIYSPAMARAGIVVPLNFLFVRASAGQRAKLLHRIAVQFAPELAAHGIVLDPVERWL